MHEKSVIQQKTQGGIVYTLLKFVDYLKNIRFTSNKNVLTDKFDQLLQGMFSECILGFVQYRTYSLISQPMQKGILDVQDD